MSNTFKDQAELLKITDVLPILTDKFVVDFANSIHVVNDHIRVQKQRTGFFSRLADSVTGTSTIRQADVNANLANGVESSLKWLGEVSESLSQSNYAIVCVNNRLNDLKHDVAKIAHYSADTHQLLNDLSDQMNERCGRLEHEVARIGVIQNAQVNIDHVFSKWSAGKYQQISLAGRCFAAVEELWWGGFGNLYRSDTGVQNKSRLIETVKHKVIDQLSKDADARCSSRIDAKYWLMQTLPLSNTNTLAEALAYLGDAANDVKQPFVFSTTQMPEKLPLRMPRICTAERLGGAMISEVFGGLYYG